MESFSNSLPHHESDSCLPFPACLRFRFQQLWRWLQFADGTHEHAQAFSSRGASY